MRLWHYQRPLDGFEHKKTFPRLCPPVDFTRISGKPKFHRETKVTNKNTGVLIKKDGAVESVNVISHRTIKRI